MLGGLAMLAWFAARDAAVRAWTVAFGAPLLLITATMVLTFSIPMAAPWRTTGAWALLLLPFEALAIVRLAAWLGGRGQRMRGAVVAAVLLAVGLLPPAARSAVYVREGMLDAQTGAWREDRAAGLHVVRELGASGAKALLDSAGNLDFLHVLDGSGAPERFVLSHGTDPLAVASYTPSQGPPPADRFSLGSGGSPEVLAAERVRLLLVRNPDSWPPWTSRSGGNGRAPSAPGCCSARSNPTRRRRSPRCPERAEEEVPPQLDFAHVVPRAAR